MLNLNVLTVEEVCKDGVTCFCGPLLPSEDGDLSKSQGTREGTWTMVRASSLGWLCVKTDLDGAEVS